MEIKRLDGTTVLTFQDIPEGALVHREIGGEHYVKLPFTTDEPVCLRIGDYIELNDFGRFELTEPYSPKYDRDTGGYDYDLQLDAHYVKWKNKVCRYIPTDNASETSFHLTASVDVHLGVIVRGINALGAKDANYRYEGKEFAFQLRNFPADKLKTTKYKQYNNTDFISALNDLANIFDCEWWVEGNQIFFGKCKLEGTEVEMEIDVNVEDMNGSESKNGYATRIIAFGSDRNLPKGYRKNSSAEITKNGIVQKRLMLPLTGEHACPNGYIQEENIASETDAVEIVVVDDDIYPRTKCRISKVETYERSSKDEVTGETISKTFYRLTDGSGFNFNTGMRLERETLRILFQSGKMNGMDFECIYDDELKYYEVVVNEDYGRELPDTSLHPELGDEFVIYGWDSTKIGNTGLIDAAEEELYQSALKKLHDLKIDPNTYTCKMMSDWYEEKMRTETFVVWSLGHPVRLVNPMFSNGARSSRIIGYEIKLDIPYDTPEYIVGEAAAYSRTKDMEQKIESLTFNGVSYQGKGAGGSGVYLITSTSSTPASDYNVYSAARSDRNYLRRDRDDFTPHKLTMREAEVIGALTVARHFGISEEGAARLASLLVGGKHGISEEGAGRLKSLTLNDRYGITETGEATMDGVRSADFRPGTAQGLDGEGFGITRDALGKYTLELDNIIARGKMILAQLEVYRMSYIGGELVLSPCGNRIDAVEARNEAGAVIDVNASDDGFLFALNGRPLAVNSGALSTRAGGPAAYYRCYFLATDGEEAVRNEWSVGQLARSRTNNIANPGTYTDYRNRDYWRIVVGVSRQPVEIGGKKYHYIDLSNAAPDTDVSITDSDGVTHVYPYGGHGAGYDSTPQAGDSVVGMGHAWDGRRWNVAVLSAINIGWVCYNGIDRFDLAEERIVNEFSTRRVRVASDRFELVPYADPTATAAALTDRGAYSPTARYGRNDLVTHRGEMWKCSVAAGETVTGEAPSVASPHWERYVMKGESPYNIVFTATNPNGFYIRNGEGEIGLVARIFKGTEDVTETIPRTRISWRRISANAAGDATWNSLHRGVGNTITVTKSEIFATAQFECLVDE